MWWWWRLGVCEGFTIIDNFVWELSPAECRHQQQDAGSNGLQFHPRLYLSHG
jgi:hypothetical protein